MDQTGRQQREKDRDSSPEIMRAGVGFIRAAVVNRACSGSEPSVDALDIGQFVGSAIIIIIIIIIITIIVSSAI